MTDPRAVDHPAEIDRDGAVDQIPFGQLERAARGDAGVVEQDIQTLPSRERVERGGPGVAIADVHDIGRGARAVGGGRCEAGGVDVGKADPPTAPGEEARGGRADARAPAGDEDRWHACPRLPHPVRLAATHPASRVLMQSPAIRFEAVTKRYACAAAVDGVTLDIAAGSFTALVGTSGSGKSTLLKMVNRLVAPDEGQVLVDGTDAAAGEAPELRRRIGYVFQSIGLFPHMTIAENIAIGLRIQARAADGKVEARCADGVRCCDGTTNFPTRSRDGCRASSRAGSASGWRSHARWRPARSCC